MVTLFSTTFPEHPLFPVLLLWLSLFFYKSSTLFYISTQILYSPSFLLVYSFVIVCLSAFSYISRSSCCSIVSFICISSLSSFTDIILWNYFYHIFFFSFISGTRGPWSPSLKTVLASNSIRYFLNFLCNFPVSFLLKFISMSWNFSAMNSGLCLLDTCFLSLLAYLCFAWFSWSNF